MKNISEILASVEETPVTFEDYLKAYADPVGELINSYIPHGTHGDMDRYLYDPLYHYSENAGKRHRPLICFAACLAVGTWISALTENQIIAAVSGVAALLLAYMMPSLRTMFTTGSAVALALFTAIAAVLSVVAGLRSKSFTLGCLSFAGCCVALTALFLLKSSWLTEAFSAVLSALCLFTPFEEFVNSSFSIPTLVYYLTVAVVFLFFTAQGLEKRRWN